MRLIPRLGFKPKWLNYVKFNDASQVLQRLLVEDGALPPVSFTFEADESLPALNGGDGTLLKAD